MNKQNSDLINKFYQSFADADAESMVACYHDDIQFEDPAFGKLQGDKAKNMWRMLVAQSKGGIKITFSNVHTGENTGSADWQAVYLFSQTGRNVINKIKAKFEFRDGKIIKHTDHFDLWKWTRQALGWKGFLLGWSSFMKKKIQKMTNGLLRKYEKSYE